MNYQNKNAEHLVVDPHSSDTIKMRSKRDLKVGIVDDNRCEKHVQSPEHQESPERIKAIRRSLKKEKLYSKLVQIIAVKPTINELSLAHTQRYVNKVIRTCSYPNGIISCQDVRVNGEDSLLSAGIAVGGVLSAVKEVISDSNVYKVFCNIRPPGHHASTTEASGFCIFNNVAVGVKKALTYPEINKVLIFDWDLHHGDGTESIFKNSSKVMFSSFHRAAPFYPNKPLTSGKYNNIHNYPQSKNNTVDDYMNDFYQNFLPIAKDFAPDIVFISCGFDSHKDDKYHALPLDYIHFEAMTKELCSIANRYSSGRLISVLEGGYSLDVLGKCAVVHIKELINSR